MLVRREIDALEKTGLSDGPVFRRCRPPSSAEPKAAWRSQWWRPISDQIRVGYLHCALLHILQYFIHSAMDNSAMQGRSEFGSSHDY